MKDELETQLSELVRKGIEVAETTGDFIIDQAPDLLQEFYRWHIVSNAMRIIISVLVIYLMFRFFKFCGKRESIKYYKTEIFGRYYEVDNEPFWFLSFLCGGVVVVFFISFIFDLFDLVKILVAPKLYLIEYFIK